MRAWCNFLSHKIFIFEIEWKTLLNISKRMQLVYRVEPSDLGPNSSPFIKWSRDSKMLACFGSSNMAFIFDRSGSKIASVPVANPSMMDWDSDNKMLAIASSDCQEISLFNLQQREVLPVDAPFTPTWLSFSRSGSFLAAGSDKGKFWIWDRASQQSQTYQGIHCDKITEGMWNTKKQLALCSEDHSISVNSVRGEVIARHEIDDTPAFPHFIRMDNQLSLIFAAASKPVIYIWEYNNNDKLTEIPFSKDLGKIVKCLTLSNGNVFIQFSSGKYSLVGFDGSIVVERQVFSTTANKADALQSKALVCAGSSMKLISMAEVNNITDEQVRFPNDANGEVCSVLLSPDGTVGAVAINCGVVLNYLVEVPILTASRGPTSVFSESLTSLVIYDMHKKKYKKVAVEAQPQKLGICPSKIAVAFNNQSWFYNVADCTLITNVEFTSSVDAIQVSDTAFAVSMGSKVMLTYFDQSKKPFVFPDFDTQVRVTAFSLTDYLLLLATDDGALRMFNTRNQAFLEGYKHPCPITSITPNLSETRFVFIDSQSNVFLFNPIKLTALSVAGEPNTIDATFTLFDITDRNVFAVIGNRQVSVYHFTDQNVNGPQLKQLCTVNVHAMKAALGLSNGTLIFLNGQSSEQTQVLPSHSDVDGSDEKAVAQLLELHRHRKALQIALKLNDKNILKSVGDHALASLCVEIASEAYAQCGDAAMHNVLQPMMNEEEYSFLRGYVSMMDRDFGAAQKNFLNSTRPQMALDMRAALLQFDFALKLAENLDPSRIPQLSHDSARQNELTGNYSAALKQYKESIKCKELAHSSRAGIIRCLILAGKVEQGMQQLAKTRDTKLILECARILERLCAFGPAAHLYTRVNEFNSAAQCHLRASELKQAGELIPKVTDTKVLRSIGLQLERAGQLEPSTNAFERASDWESLVRVLLKINLDRATAVARDHPLVSVCRLVAEHCIQLNNFRFAIEFLIRAGKSDDAFRIAELHEKMDELADLIGENGTPQQYEAIATYFCTRSQMIQAAKFFAIAGDPQRAMNCYMADGSDRAMDAALELAERVPDRQLRDQFLEYLNANMKDKTRDLRYLLRMFIIMQQFDEAAAMALKIADEFRLRGEYKPSRDLLFDIICQLEKHEVAVSNEMRQALMIVHSYLLIKPQREKNKVIAALLLRRLSKYVSKFPAHASNLLVMAVVECSRVGMKKSAFEIATKVLQPEYEGKVKPDVLKKIQTTVRRKDMSEVDEEKTKCPVCGFDVPMSELYCGNCKSNLPYDSLSGMHMTREDWCECPHCHFPASFSAMQQEKACPLCGTEIESPELIVNPQVK
ncbi:WD repeat protein [Tritrichomonas foetus]|uniref:WD repeat protein n=1 Tax=Tritrichomonas foetus TaxID=1144522 RepID=A0A1J4JJS6_9EUKA|nr:WD repeat protein [Tritrichomonas foetus]|eukprot:OHS97492.1 WD repeat protein [Tritrichomonas foetus]